MRGSAILMLIMLAGCGQEEDFDTRFERTKADLEHRSEILERDLAARKAAEKGAGTAETAVGLPKTAASTPAARSTTAD